MKDEIFEISDTNSDILSDEMYQIYHDMDLYYEKEQRRSNRCLSIAKQLLTKEQFDEMYEQLTDAGSTNQYSITKTIGAFHDDADDSDTGLISYVNQYENGGYEGDSYAGQIWVKLNNKHYFTYIYQS